jgi:hypothetical protein
MSRRKIRDGFNALHTPGFRLTPQDLAARGVQLDRNAQFQTDLHGDTNAYLRWMAELSMVPRTTL